MKEERKIKDYHPRGKRIKKSDSERGAKRTFIREEACEGVWGRRSTTIENILSTQGGKIEAQPPFLTAEKKGGWNTCEDSQEWELWTKIQERRVPGAEEDPEQDRKVTEPGMLPDACNPSTWNAKTEGFEVLCQSELQKMVCVCLCGNIYTWLCRCVNMWRSEYLTEPASS